MFKRICVLIAFFATNGLAQMPERTPAEKYGLHVIKHEGWQQAADEGPNWYRVQLIDPKNQASTAVLAFVVPEEWKKRRNSGNVRDWALKRQWPSFIKSYSEKQPYEKLDSSEEGVKMGDVDMAILHHRLSVNDLFRYVSYFFGASVVEGREIWYYGYTFNSGLVYLLKGSEVLRTVLDLIKLGPPPAPL